MPVVLPLPNGSLTSKRAVAVGVAQRNRPAAGLRLTAAAAGHQRDVQIAVGRHGHVPRRSEVVGHDQRAESWGQREAAVVGIAHRPGLSVDAGNQKPERGNRATDGHCTRSAEIHNSSPCSRCGRRASSRRLWPNSPRRLILTRN